MNSEGFLPLALIASFARVRELTTNFELVAQAVSESEMLELKMTDDGLLVS
jgi:hypothetical protein